MTSLRAWAKHNQTRLMDIRHSVLRERFVRMREGSHGEHRIVLLINASLSASPLRIVIRFVSQHPRTPASKTERPFATHAGGGSRHVILAYLSGLIVALLVGSLGGIKGSAERMTRWDQRLVLPPHRLLKKVGPRIRESTALTSRRMTRDSRASNKEDLGGTARAELNVPTIFRAVHRFFVIHQAVTSFSGLFDALFPGWDESRSGMIGWDTRVAGWRLTEFDSSAVDHAIPFLHPTLVHFPALWQSKQPGVVSSQLLSPPSYHLTRHYPS
ncbi:hypothetical protein C8J56DRAFT_897758 [Mycena floridula]|nr:hypothetical protein C8J56DRAFT_897758 [Mycena floridula]